MDKWVIYSFIASILSALTLIILKVFTDNVGFLLISFVIVGIMSLIYLLGFYTTDVKVMLPYAFLYAILFISISSFKDSALIKRILLIIAYSISSFDLPTPS